MVLDIVIFFDYLSHNSHNMHNHILMHILINYFAGIWKSKKELELMRNEGQTKIFLPTESRRESKLDKYRQWVEACHRFKHWHSGRQ